MRFRQIILFLLYIIISLNIVVAQEESAVFEVESQDKGVLIPRMSSNQWVSILNPADGLMVYDSSQHTFYYFNGTVWQTMSQGAIGPIGVSVDSIKSMDNRNGTFDIYFHKSDSSTDTITTPDLSGGASNSISDLMDSIGVHRTDINAVTSKADDLMDSIGVQRMVLDAHTDSIGVHRLDIDMLKSSIGGSSSLKVGPLLGATGDSIYLDTTNVSNNQMISFDGNNWVAADIITGNTGGGNPIDIVQPFQVVNFVIATQGTFPSENLSTQPYIGGIGMFAGNFEPQSWKFCDGQLLSIAQNTALFSILGTTYGGDGETTLGLPDLRGRVPMHEGSGSGLTPRTLGQKGGDETETITVSQMPSHSHTVERQ
jgi:microcystin-dependent protein